MFGGKEGEPGKILEGEWELVFQSVIVYGRMKVIRDMDTIKAIAKKLSLQLAQDEERIAREVKTKTNVWLKE